MTSGVTEPRVIVVTGASKGIGLHLAEHYLGHGYAVAGCSRGASSLKHALYVHYQADVTDERDVSALMKGVVHRFGRLDVLINNAGVASMNHIITMPTSTAESIVRTNLVGSFLCTREAGKAMIARKWGRIVNLTSVARPLALPGEAVYAASKAGVEELTKVAAKELGSFNITVNAIGAAPVMTDLIRHVPAEKIERLLDQLAIRRMGEYRDISNVADFLISEASDFVTGQIIYLGGVC